MHSIKNAILYVLKAKTFITAQYTSLGNLLFIVTQARAIKTCIMN